MILLHNASLFRSSSRRVQPLRRSDWCAGAPYRTLLASGHAQTGYKFCNSITSCPGGMGSSQPAYSCNNLLHFDLWHRRLSHQLGQG